MFMLIITEYETINKDESDINKATGIVKNA